MTKVKSKLHFLIYAICSAIGFSYLVLPEKSGFGVVVFMIMQCFFLHLLLPDKKRLWITVPMFILSCNSFISANGIWRAANFIVFVFLYAMLSAEYNSRFWISLLENVINPISKFPLPFQWGMKTTKGKGKVIGRILIALLITFPVLLVLILLLSSADMVFRNEIWNVWKELRGIIKFSVIRKGIIGIIAGCYLFGSILQCYRLVPPVKEKAGKQGDLIIFILLLSGILTVYTAFCIIQFKYLFAGAQLPFDLTYTEYARKGFFELLFLTGINIFLILLTVFMTKEKKGFGKQIAKVLCSYLCAITVVLLISSFYRMYLYCLDDGLTRMRFLVFGFLIFEGIGLLVTFGYIINPKFSMVTVYAAIALTYYLVLNIIPIDYFVAKSQVDMYLSGKREGVEYVLTLSEDAAPQIERLLTSDAKEQAKEFFCYHIERNNEIPNRWQRWNLSDQRCQNIYDRHFGES
ncbi:MAG: DUF4173 domain-containing protein [Ruminococcaceae bacterium]|nr:DUF4173 domain-containing protein [Oscillospiraceae bacterium]